MGFVDIQSVVKRYEGRLAIDHLNFSIGKGEIFGLLGPNGAGKSTTIQMLCGLTPIDQGSIAVAGLPISRFPIEVKRMIGLVPQEPALFDMLTAEENVTFFARLHGLRGRLLKARTAEALAFTGMSEHRLEKPSVMSGGMKRRLNIACAVVHRPELLVMDEPTVGVDPASRQMVLESVRTLNREGTTIIYSSHYMEEIEAVCSRIGILDQGRLIAVGTLEELRGSMSGEETFRIEVTAGNPEAVAELSRHPGIRKADLEGSSIVVTMRSSQTYLQDVLFILSKFSMTVRTINRLEVDLETLFLTITGKQLRG